MTIGVGAVPLRQPAGRGYIAVPPLGEHEAPPLPNGRFSRILRLRPDKRVADISTLEEVRALVDGSD